MHSANAFSIRPATDADAYVLRKLADLDGHASVSLPALIGEIDGTAAAAMSLEDGRIVADPFQHTAKLSALLTMRFRAMRSFARTQYERRRRSEPIRFAA
jgi:hypothetical protein